MLETIQDNIFYLELALLPFVLMVFCLGIELEITRKGIRVIKPGKNTNRLGGVFILAIYLSVCYGIMAIAFSPGWLFYALAVPIYLFSTWGLSPYIQTF